MDGVSKQHLSKSDYVQEGLTRSVLLYSLWVSTNGAEEPRFEYCTLTHLFVSVTVLS